MPPFSSDDKATFDELYKKARSMGDGNRSQLVSAAYKMMKLLQTSKRAQRDVQIHPKRMGIHPKNRGGKKMQIGVMFKKGVKIVRVGFSKELCGSDRAVAFEQNITTKNIEKHTMNVTKTSENFAKYDVGSVRAGAVGCTHLNQFLAAVSDGVKCPKIYISELCDQGNDRLSKDSLTHNNDDFRAACTDGLRWFVIDADVEDEYPDLPDIFQRALNVEHHIGEGYRYKSIQYVVGPHSKKKRNQQKTV